MPKQAILTPELLAAALEGLQAQRQQIESQIAEVRRMLGSRVAAVPDGSATTPRKRTMSAAAKRRIAEAQRKRWAAFHKKEATASKPATGAARRQKRKLSAEGRKRIIEATRKRWAAFRAAKKRARS